MLVVELIGCSHSPTNYPKPSKKVTGATKTVSATQPEEAQSQQGLQSFYRRWKGTPYKYGGLSSRGVDCSGFVFLAYKDVFNFSLPRMTRHQLRYGQRIEKSELQAGDLVFFKTSKKVWHVGIYIGDNRFIHASTSKGVITSNLDNPYWNSKYRVARRIEI
ncbi:MAG: NlpC/P60 family protein [Kangiellaceae bacterium]|nr:NlpC/P60 family protein [Kangiellaceae bacterium]MCW8997561.1 NlpC/P60 family protein [Kangiellaceae bacterium]